MDCMNNYGRLMDIKKGDKCWYAVVNLVLDGKGHTMQYMEKTKKAVVEKYTQEYVDMIARQSKVVGSLVIRSWN